MRRLLIALFVVLAWSSVSWGATYYACIAGNISVSNAWEDAVGCDGTTYTIGTAGFPAAGSVLEANNNAMVIDTNPGPNGNVVLANTAGGNFSATAAGSYTIDAGVTGGTVDCLLIGTGSNEVTANICTTSGGCTFTTQSTANADGIYIDGTNVTTTIGKSGSPVTVTGGGAANYAIYDAHTSLNSRKTTIYGNITGGPSAINAMGVRSGNSGAMDITGNINGGGGANTYGLTVTSNATVVVDGNSTGGSVSSGLHISSSSTVTLNGYAKGGNGIYSYGVYDSAGTGTYKITGSIIDSATTSGKVGKVQWQPANATKYYQIINSNTGPTYHYLISGIASAADGTEITAANTAAQIKSTAWFHKKDGADGAGTLTQGTAASGGGAWAR